VLEFNCRLGDPEAQTILPLLEGDVLGAFHAAATGRLSGTELFVSDAAAVTIVLAAADYPERGDSGTPIELGEVEALVFHAGTAARSGHLLTNGGRILNVTATGADLDEARDRAYAAVGRISFPGMRYRSDVAANVHA
jgi:phosphoribosylamine--glycine ligase